MRRALVPLLLLIIVGLCVALALALQRRPNASGPVQVVERPPPAAPGARQRQDPGTRPHIVLLILDTLRADRVGHLNPDLPQGVSPELDALAAEGVRFERAIAPASWTRPSVGSLVTSRHPRELGLYEEQWDRLPESATTLAEVLGEAGYRTVGLTANPNINRAFNFDQGFDVYIDSNVVFQWMDSAPTQRVRSATTHLRSALEVFQLALQLSQSPRARPTYLQIDVMEMHEAAGHAMFRPGSLAHFTGHPDHRYLAMLRQLSQDVGAFVRELSSRPGWEDTLFVVTSDHGEGLGSHPGVADSRYHGPLLYESQCWVPLFLYHPGGGLPGGTAIERPVRLLDVMPTLLAFAGVAPPDGMEGRSLVPLFRPGGQAASVDLPDYFVVETYWRDREKIGVYSGDFKYIHNRKPHAGTPVRELQPNRILENGDATDVGSRHPALLQAHAEFLAGWERRHRRVAADSPAEGVTPAEAAQLKALGYVE